MLWDRFYTTQLIVAVLLFQPKAELRPLMSRSNFISIKRGIEQQEIVLSRFFADDDPSITPYPGEPIVGEYRGKMLCIKVLLGNVVAVGRGIEAKRTV